MSTENKQTQQKMSIYFPVELLARVRRSAERNKRSFNKEVLWLVEQSLERQEKSQQLL
jgi:Arc-like DNA binding domain